MIGRALGLILIVCATGWAQAPTASDRVIIVVGGMDPGRTGPLDSDSLSAKSHLGSRSDPLSSYAPMSVKSSPPRSVMETFSNNSLEIATALGGPRKGYHFVPWSGNLFSTNDHENAIKAVKEFIVKQLAAGKIVSVLAHSDGAMIAYNAINLLPSGAKVDKFVTIGTLGSDITGDSRHALASGEAGKTIHGDLVEVEKPENVTSWLNIASTKDRLSAVINSPGIINVAIRKPDESMNPLVLHSQYYTQENIRSAIDTVLKNDSPVGVLLEQSGSLVAVNGDSFRDIIEREAGEKPKLTAAELARTDARLKVKILRDEARREFQQDIGYEDREDQMSQALKTADYQLAKSITDAHGNRVRIEAYVLRPQPNQVQQLVLNTRQQRFDYGYILSTFFKPISGLEEAKTVTLNTFSNPTMPSNYLTQSDLVATNTEDRIQETTTLGAPTALNFGASTRYFPSTINTTLRLSGLGYNTTKMTVATTHDATQFTFHVQYPDATSTLSDYINLTYTPSTGVCVSCAVIAAAAPTQTVGSTASPAGGVNSTLVFKDGSFLATDSWWVTNDGKISHPPVFSSPLEDPKSVLNNLNLEMRFTASEFKNDIDIVLPGEALATGANGGQDVRKD